jgi:uncharacterized protein YkwD
MLGWPTSARLILTAVTALIATVVGLAAPATLGTGQSAGHAAAAYRSAPAIYEDRVVYWTNVKRKRHGLRPLRKRTCPDTYAERWSRHLASVGSFYHQDIRRLFNCHRVNVSGENLARGSIRPRRVVNLWMRSPGHRANILNRRFTHIGVGSVYSVRDSGRLYTVQTFTGR